MAQPTNTFRVFVSSTFKDLVEERNALQKYVFPRLRELCQRHNCRFQAIDLRWGISPDASTEQQEMRICLEEIKRCQEVTPRPNFIVLLGDRYGSRLLPWEIPQSEFEQIVKALHGDERLSLLREWYPELDQNAVPPVYDLKARGDDRAKWKKEVETKLLEILDAGTRDLGPSATPKYWASATEQEIMRGVMETPDAAEHVFAFFRHIADAPEQAKSFVESLPANAEGIDPQSRLRTLKKRLKLRLPNNVVEYSVRWGDNTPTYDHIGLIDSNLSLDECLKLNEEPDQPSTLCVDVWKKLSKVILGQIVELYKIEPLKRDTDEHDKWSEERIRHFRGRESTLNAISEYVVAKDRQPLAIWGEPGSGKTSLLGKAHAICLEKHPNAVAIMQLIGATPQSTDGRSLLQLLCKCVSNAYGGDMNTIPADYRELVQEFPKRLALATAEKPLVIFLDALDQLSDADNCRSLIWLPRELPEHVRLIVSTTPDNKERHNECYSTLDRRRLPANRFIQLERMPSDEAGEVLDAMLKEINRTLQPHQRQEVMAKYEGVGLPLYLKLAFEEARRWKSYSDPGKTVLMVDVPSLIDQMFRRLCDKANHGDLLVKRSVGLLCAAKRGLSEDELIDVLSRDKDIMQPLRDTKQKVYKLGGEDPLPVIIWSRLFFDLKPYLASRAAEGATVINFYHQQVRERAVASFMKEEDAVACHQMLADYFDRPENPWWNESIEAQRARAKRLPPTPRPANLRKVVELPYQRLEVAKLAGKDDPKSPHWDAVADLLTNWEFLEAKTEADPNFREQQVESNPSATGEFK